MPLTPEQRRRQAAQAAYVRWSRHNPNDPDAAPARARAGFERTFLDQVDPDRVLPEAERQRRAECARKAYFLKMSAAGVQARRAKAAARRGDAA